MRVSKLVVLNTRDEKMLTRALKLEGKIVLMQDAVLFTNSRVEANKCLLGYKIYALKSDVEKRGLSDRLLDNVELLDVDQLVDLLFSDKTVVNL